MKRKEMESLLEKALKSFRIKGEIGFMCGCTVEGDFGTYEEGFGITIKGDEDKAWRLKNRLEEYLDKHCDELLSLYYGEQTADSDRNYDMGDESYKYSHVIVMLSCSHRFER